MSNYIMDLRKVVGHAPLLQAGASIIVENENGQVLLGRRTDNHQWGYAGGSIELGETVEEAAKRELFEEMGLVADEMELFYINSGEETHYIYPNGDEVYNVEIIYICRKYHGTIKRPVSYTHLRAHETGRNLVCRLLLEKKKKNKKIKQGSIISTEKQKN